MRAVFMTTLLMGLIACSDNDYVCVDVLDEGEGDGLDEDFLGVEVCYYAFADDKTCEDEGGTAVVMGDYGVDETCPEQGFGFRCGQVATVKNAEDCPEEYEVVEL